MKLKYETRARAVGADAQGKAGYGGWHQYKTNAKTASALVERMRREAKAALEKRCDFYENYPAACKLDVYEEDHVWSFHTYAPLSNGVLRFDAYAVKKGGSFGEIDYCWCGESGTGDEWSRYKKRREHYENLAAQTGSGDKCEASPVSTGGVK